MYEKKIGEFFLCVMNQISKKLSVVVLTYMIIRHTSRV
jgi:hypothetical protein